MAKMIRMEQCYFCPHILIGSSTLFDDVGWCKLYKRTLSETMVETEKDTWIQTIPDWCELEEAV